MSKILIILISSLALQSNANNLYANTPNLDLSKNYFHTYKKDKTMQILYKKINNKLNYWEVLEKDDETVVIHWGIVGEVGQTKELKRESTSDLYEVLETEFDKKIKEGYAEFDEDDYSFLQIEFIIEGFGTDEDLNKRLRLEDKMEEIMSETVIGFADGGSTKNGLMKVGCLVVDFEIAKKIIEEKLKNTEFSDYSKIIKTED